MKGELISRDEKTNFTAFKHRNGGFYKHTIQPNI